MAQMSWRTSEDLLEQVRRQAEQHGQSLNEWVTTVLTAASDPSYAGTAADQVRERLARAGLLQRPEGVQSVKRPDRKALVRARAAAGKGSPLSGLVGDGRR